MINALKPYESVFAAMENNLAAACSKVGEIKDFFITKFMLLMENAFEFGRIAESLAASGKIKYEDSKELFFFCRDLAFEFEKNFDEGFDDYYEKIEEFARQKLSEEFGVKPETSFFKNVIAYAKDMHEVCYQTSAGVKWTHSQLLAVVQGDSRLCATMFSSLDGQSPQAFLEETLKSQVWRRCDCCGRLYSACDDSIEECPHCHTILSGDENPLDVYKAAVMKGE